MANKRPDPEPRVEDQPGADEPGSGAPLWLWVAGMIAIVVVLLAIFALG